VKLETDAKIILEQLLRTDKNVTFLHPLIDLLSLPEDQRETLGDRLAQLLTDLNETLKHHHDQQKDMTLQLTRLGDIQMKEIAAAQEWRAQQAKQMGQILKILGQPLV
jgi:hypothetical protein